VFFPTRSRLPPSFYFVEVSYPNIACDFKHVRTTLFLYSPENSLNNPNKKNLAAHADDSFFDREFVMTRLVKTETSFQWFQTSFSQVEHDYINCMDSWMQIPLFRGKLSISHGTVTPVQYSTIHYNWFTTPIFVGSPLHLAILDHFGVSPVSPLSPLPP
jgi:hypothetical protein